MSGPPQTPNRYIHATTPQQQQQLLARQQATPQQQQLAMQQQLRPNMQFRPGMTPLQQQQLYMANRVGMTPQQQQLYAQQYQQQQQQQMRPGMVYPQQMAGGANVPRPGVPPPQQQQQHNQFIHPGTASIAVAGVGVQGQQPHPALIQPQTPTGRRRKGNKGGSANDVTGNASEDHGAAAGGESGDELDNLQPYNVSLMRYQNNHNLMSDIFVALPTSTINVPKHYYESLDKDRVKGDLEQYVTSFEESEKEHEAKIEELKKEREEFATLIKTLVEAKPAEIDQIKRQMESHFAMEFVNSPYKTVDRIAVDKIDAVEGAVYKQL
ncbi:hypothetical protein EV175_000666 [Coemansia sp. RSA 1933]|nr:hypothetical protein EV175_000666 [Coemansia sp. RSA 1933]